MLDCVTKQPPRTNNLKEVLGWTWALRRRRRRSMRYRRRTFSLLIFRAKNCLCAGGTARSNVAQITSHLDLYQRVLSSVDRSVAGGGGGNAAWLLIELYRTLVLQPPKKSIPLFFLRWLCKMSLLVEASCPTPPPCNPSPNPVTAPPSHFVCLSPLVECHFLLVAAVTRPPPC